MERKMKNNKLSKMKWKPVLLAAVLCLGLLVGCGNQKTEPEQTKSVQEEKESTESVSQPEEKQETENIVVTMYGMDDQNGAAEVIEAVNAYTEDKIGVTITFKPIPTGDYTSKLQLDLASSEEMDLCWMASYTGFDNLVAGNALMALDDLLEKYPALYESMPDMVWESTLKNGSKYIVPNYKEMGTGFSIVTPKSLADTIKEKYNIDFNALKLDGYQSFDLLSPYLAACKEEGVSAVVCDIKTIGGDIFANAWERLDSNSYVVLDTVSGETLSFFETPEVKEFFELMYDWNQKGYFPEEVALGGYNSTPYKQAGDYGIYYWQTVPDNEQTAYERFGVEVYAIELMETKFFNTSALGSGWSIAAKSQKADACMKFLELLNTDSYLADLFVYGVEGVNYTKDTDGLITRTADSGWKNEAWKSCSYKNVSRLTSEVGKLEKYDAFNQAVQPSVTLGFSFDPTPVEAEIAAMKPVRSEYITLISRGFYDPEEYLPKFIDGLNNAGFEKVKEEIIRQYQEWKDAQ